MQCCNFSPIVCLIAAAQAAIVSIALPLQTADLTPQELRYLVIETTVALQADAQTAEYELKVEPRDEALVLTGEVLNESARTLAERIALVICRDYPVEVVNKIRVKQNASGTAAAPPVAPTRLDQQQADKLRSILESEFSDLSDGITVNFELQPMPTIVLEGLVPSYEQKLALSSFVRKEYKQLPVLNNLQVRRRELGGKTVYTVSPEDTKSVIIDKRSEREVIAEREPRPARPSDEALAESLAAVLKDDPVIRDALIKLRVRDGVVWVSGKVAGVGQRNRVLRLLEEQPDVRYAVDQLVLVAAEPREGLSNDTNEPRDVTFQIRRAIVRRIPALAGSKIEVLDRTVTVTPATERPFAQAEIDALEARLARIPEMKGYTLVVRPKLSISEPRGS